TRPRAQKGAPRECSEASGDRDALPGPLQLQLMPAQPVVPRGRAAFSEHVQSGSRRETGNAQAARDPQGENTATIRLLTVLAIDTDVLDEATAPAHRVGHREVAPHHGGLVVGAAEIGLELLSSNRIVGNESNRRE